MVDGQAGKGDTYRPVNQELYEKNWERIFGKKELSKKEKEELDDAIDKAIEEYKNILKKLGEIKDET